MSLDPGQATVVVVEDNPDNMLVLEMLLREEVGVRYYNGRASGRQFFKLLETNPELHIDLILLDLHLPHEDGYSILEKIRLLPALASTRVVAVTSSTTPQDVQHAREAGFDGFIGKPIDRLRFPQQIRRILHNESVWEPQ